MASALQINTCSLPYRDGFCTVLCSADGLDPIEEVNGFSKNKDDQKEKRQ